MKSVWPPKPLKMRALIREALAWPKGPPERGVDRHHEPLLGDQARVVGVLGAHHPHPVIAVDPVVELLAA